MNPHRSPSPGRQLRLPLSRAPSYRRGDFIISAGNVEALAALDAWPAWAGGRLALVGPEGSGKTHLARMWARAVGAMIAKPDGIDISQLAGQPVLLEDADRGLDDATLFHLINMADAGGSLLVTARVAPRDWPTDLPDLRSRLNALMVAKLEAPDDVILQGVLRKFFRDRNIKPDDEVLPYLVRRIERSIPAALAVVSRLDEAADAAGRKVNSALVREVLEGEDESLDLFE